MSVGCSTTLSRQTDGKLCILCSASPGKSLAYTLSMLPSSLMAVLTNTPFQVHPPYRLVARGPIVSPIISIVKEQTSLIFNAVFCYTRLLVDFSVGHKSFLWILWTVLPRSTSGVRGHIFDLCLGLNCTSCLIAP